MHITEEQFRRIEGCFPTQRGNVKISNLDVLNAILYVAENGCKWRSLPKRFGRWHTIYTRMNRLEALSLDSTIVQVHPDGTGAEKKTARSPSDDPEAGGAPKFIWLPRMIGEQ